MYKPTKGQCSQCPPGELKIIPTKRGLCQKHLYEYKKSKKKGDTVRSISLGDMKRKGYVKRAIDMATDWALEADKLFSEWIRRRHANLHGRSECVTCGDKKHWRQQTCGHYVKRRHLGCRLYDKNAGCVCFRCNSEMESNPALERSLLEWLIDQYGPEVVADLEMRKNATVKLSQEDYKDICAELRQKIESL